MKKQHIIAGLIFMTVVCSSLFANVPCDQLPADQCPKNLCTTMINCRGEEICHFKMIEPPSCGDLSYAGQDVPCCPGLIRRCGVAFLDMTCDMFGDHSEYDLPICIPCGDGICGNFENVCNCPEDCHPDEAKAYDGQKFDEEAEEGGLVEEEVKEEGDLVKEESETGPFDEAEASKP